MNSKYAWAHFLEGISKEDQNIRGESVKFNYPTLMQGKQIL